jgi:type IV secretory pathway TraG/TraD family ATPase VirD4
MPHINEIPLVWLVVGGIVLLVVLGPGRSIGILGRVAWAFLRICGGILSGLLKILWHGAGAAGAAAGRMNRPRPGAVIGPEQNRGAIAADGDFQDYRGLARAEELCDLDNGNIRLGTYLRPSGRRGRDLRFARDLLYSGCAVVGPSGSGKTVGIILPWIEMLLQSGASVVTVDVKGDLYQSAEGAARAAGARFLYWCAGDPRSQRWNWLDEIDNDRDIEAAVRAVLGRPNPRDSQPHFYERDCRWLRGLINVAMHEGRSRPVPTDLMRLAADRDQLAAAFRNSVAAQNYAVDLADLLSMSAEEHSRAASGLLNALHLFGSADVARVSDASDFRTDEIGREPTLLVIGAPLADARRAETLSAIMLSRAFNAVYDRFLVDGKERGLPVFFIIDEAARLKDRIAYEEVLSVVRSAGAGVCLAMQDVTQLGDTEARTAVLANCHTMIALRGCSAETARYFAGRLGERRQSTIMEGKARGYFDLFPGQRSQMVQTSTTEVLGQREIMHPPAECGRWCGIAHIPSVCGKPFLVDLTREEA